MGADNPRYASGGAYDERVSVGCVCEGDIIIIIIIVAYHGGKQSGKDDERELSEQNDHQDHDVLHRQHTHTHTPLQDTSLHHNVLSVTLTMS